MHNILISKLIKYSEVHLGLTKYNSRYAANQLLELFKQDDYTPINVNSQEIISLETPDIILNECFEYLLENNIYNIHEEDMALTKIMGLISQSPDLVDSNFHNIHTNQSPSAATNYLYDLGIKNFYIKKNAISNNLFWKTNFKEDNLEITINLSKPEKDNKEIAKLLEKNTSNKKYPECMLCLENLGFKGKINYPARQTLRFTSLKLNSEDWFMQYSPYAYYNEHMICINENHTPMNVDKFTIVKLLDFVDYIPHYFIGSNASLPIVGGSILNHEHYQGGLHKLPMMYSTTNRTFVSTEFDVTVHELNWYAKSIRVTSKSRKEIEKFGEKVINVWENFNDETIDVISNTNETRHNVITPICYKNNDLYTLDIIFRNNRTSKQFPDGIFHAHPQYHNIKKEGIGLIEAMGLFILPGRLKKEIQDICDCIDTNNTNISSDSNLFKHLDMIKDLIKNKPSSINTESFVKERINITCREILKNISIFKNDDKGTTSFNKLTKLLNLKLK